MPRASAPDLTVRKLEELLRRRRKELADLHKERASLQRRLATVDGRISQLEGRGMPGRPAAAGRRARNTKSLIEALTDVLAKSGKPMKVSDIVDAVQASGYQSTSANFRGIVNQTLIKEKRFTSPSRSYYELKK